MGLVNKKFHFVLSKYENFSGNTLTKVMKNAGAKLSNFHKFRPHLAILKANFRASMEIEPYKLN